MFSSAEIEIIEKLGHPLYTVEFLEEWVGRNDNVMVNAPAALQAIEQVLAVIKRHLEASKEANITIQPYL